VARATSVGGEDGREAMRMRRGDRFLRIGRYGARRGRYVPVSSCLLVRPYVLVRRWSGGGDGIVRTGGVENRIGGGYGMFLWGGRGSKTWGWRREIKQRSLCCVGSDERSDGAGLVEECSGDFARRVERVQLWWAKYDVGEDPVTRAERVQ
jgi:hypothetical protein